MPQLPLGVVVSEHILIISFESILTLRINEPDFFCPLVKYFASGENSCSPCLVDVFPCPSKDMPHLLVSSEEPYSQISQIVKMNPYLLPQVRCDITQNDIFRSF